MGSLILVEHEHVGIYALYRNGLLAEAGELKPHTETAAEEKAAAEGEVLEYAYVSDDFLGPRDAEEWPREIGGLAGTIRPEGWTP